MHLYKYGFLCLTPHQNGSSIILFRNLVLHNGYEWILCHMIKKYLPLPCGLTTIEGFGQASWHSLVPIIQVSRFCRKAQITGGVLRQMKEVSLEFPFVVYLGGINSVGSLGTLACHVVNCLLLMACAWQRPICCIKGSNPQRCDSVRFTAGCRNIRPLKSKNFPDFLNYFFLDCSK